MLKVKGFPRFNGRKGALGTPLRPAHVKSVVWASAKASKERPCARRFSQIYKRRPSPPFLTLLADSLHSPSSPPLLQTPLQPLLPLRLIHPHARVGRACGWDAPEPPLASVRAPRYVSNTVFTVFSCRSTVPLTCGDFLVIFVSLYDLWWTCGC